MPPAEDPTRKLIVTAVRRRLAGDGHATARALTPDLFAQVAVEDLGACSAERLAAIAEVAAGLLATRKPGVTRVAIAELPAGSDDRPATLVAVANDNMPFLLDSTIGEIQASGASILLVAHPIVTVERDRSGGLAAYHGTLPAGAPAIRESLITVAVDRLPPEAASALAERLASLFAEIRTAVADWQPMLQRLAEATATYRSSPPPVPAAELAEAIAFLDWLDDGNFTFLGAREYVFTGGAEAGELARAEKPGLGILSDPAVRVLRRGGVGVTTTPEIREFLMRPEPLIVAKSNLRSRIHRRAYADYVGLKLYAADGSLAGELRFIGLFTSTAYTGSTRAIPYLRRKVDRILSRAGFDPDSHSGKALVNVLETYPRDELFQIDEDTLFAFALAVLALDERPRVRVLARRDRFDRFVSVLVYVPRDRYDSAVRVRIGEYLARAYGGHVSAFYPAFPEGPLARVHFIIGRPDATPTPDLARADLEGSVASIIQVWADALAEAIDARFAPGEAATLRDRYAAAFPAGYREAHSPGEAAGAIAVFEALSDRAPIAVAFRRGPADAPAELSLTLVHRGAPVALSVRVPMLENMGFTVIDEQTYEVRPAGAPELHVHDMSLRRAEGGAVEEAALAGLDACFMAAWERRAENDGYNALVVNAGIAWRDIALLRTVSRYLHQAGTAYSQHYMWATLNRHPGIARDLVALFHARFDPAAADDAAATAAMAAIETALESVPSLDEDRIVRRFMNVIRAAVRTNFFQAGADGRPHAEITLKLDSALLDELPAPRPFREIFLHSPRVEGIHLRFGKVARGGIRWSDRPADFRTEILGLAKAQQVKNAVIVPVGAKGGFVPKELPQGADRAAVLAEGTAAYRIFIQSLLDITDDLDGDAVVPPAGLLRREGDDPYLVVAADKGTATFSDTANAIAVGRGFWLGDAFASGGSAGYDHKKMGITARGAWEAVKRHFREMDTDIQATPFTVVGVGDMSGDVFGNAMLLSPETKLVAAFDHRDIFIDPDPDPAVSLAERRRLFELPRSSWQDYDRTKLSAGGGIFSRSEKAIRLGRQAKALLDIDRDSIAPQDLIRAILRARADLLFFGGIGTFVRAAEESDDRVGDRANDAVRVTASELRVRVVGEGANLGMTQRARIAFGLAGGRCNSDAIDNSAGVNTSDVEVNIKIALGRAERESRLDRKRRDRLLAAMTDEVAALVLRNNYLQTLAISLTRDRGFEDFGYQLGLMQDLERRSRLDRALEALPDDAAMAERQAKGQPLTRAEIGVLVAYAKIVAFDDLIAGRVADDPTLDNELIAYFPARMRKAHAGDIEAHRLRAEIIATMIANAMVNRGGPTYLVRVAERTGADAVAIARAHVAVRDAFGLEDLNAAIDALDGTVAGAVQLGLYRAVQDLLLDKTIWFLRNAAFADGVGPVAEAYGRSVEAVSRSLQRVLPGTLLATLARDADDLAAKGVPAGLAERIARLPALADATDIHLVAAAAAKPLEAAADAYFALGDELRIARIEALARRLPVTDHYDGLARDRALDALAAAQRLITIDVLSNGGIGAWRTRHQAALGRAVDAVRAMTEGEELTVSRLVVATGLIGDLARR